MSATLDLVEQLNHASPTTLTPSMVEWHTHSDQWCFRVEAHAPGVYRLRWGPLNWLEPKKISLRMQRQKDMLLAREEAVSEMQCQQLDSSIWSLAQGETSLQINTKGIAIYQADTLLAQASFTEFTNTDENDWQIIWDLAKDEKIYGLGESTESLTRQGQKLVSDKPQDRCLPLAWSASGWGAYINTLNRQEHDLKSAQTYKITTKSAGLDLFIFVGQPEEILNQYTSLTGRAGQPEIWSMGVWLDQASGQSITDSLTQIKSMREQEIAIDTLSLAEPAILNFQADKPVFDWSEQITDWRQLQADLANYNLHIAGATYPGVLQGTELFEEWEDRGWLLTDENGDAWVHPGLPASNNKPFGLLDLTYQDTAKLWADRHQQAIEEGLGALVCNAQFDFPEAIDARGGESGDLLRTMYPHLSRQALFNAVAAWRTPQEGVVASRDLFPGAQRFAWQQGPDVSNDWAGLKKTIVAALSSGNSGIAAQTHKLGNANLKSPSMDAELYLRWLAMCVFSANFSFQGAPGLMPDAFDDKTKKIIAHWLQWRYRLLPYIAGIVDDAVRTGLPVQRSMAQSFPADVKAHAYETQYMLGPALLVAPIVQAGETAEIYLPAGEAWWDLNTGWRYEGGTTWQIKLGLDSIPVFGREGHMLCIGPATQHTGEINSARILEEVWMFGMPEHNPVVMRNKIRVMQMQGSSYIKGLEGLKIIPAEGLEVKRRGAEVRISRAR